MSVMSATKGGFAAIKSHWLFFLIAAAVLVGLAVSYDAKHAGAIRTRVNQTLAKLPVIGSWFGS